MNPFASIFVLVGSALALMASVGLLRMRTTPARLHAAGKASPVALVVTAIGAATETGIAGVALLLVAVGALVLTLPMGVHLLLRGLYRSGQIGSVAADQE